MTPPTSRDKILVLAAVCLAGLMLPFSFTGPAVATPAIARAFGGSTVALNWVVNIFILAFGSCVMAAGALADQLGRKRVFRIGVIWFTLASLLMSFAPNLFTLNLLRAVQGVAAAATMSGGAAALAQEFEGQARTRAFSLLGTTFGVGLAFGPLWSGYLIDWFGWRAVFATDVVLGALVLIFGLPHMRETRNPDAGGLDWPGTLTFTGALLLLTCGIMQGPQSGWSSIPVILLFGGFVILLGLFITIELRVARPMLDLSLFRYPRFVGVQSLPIATAFCYVVLLITLPIQFVGIEGYDEVSAGLMMIPLSAPIMFVPLIASMLAKKIPAGLLAGIGLLLATVGLLWLSTIDIGTQTNAIIWPLLLIGLGAGLPWGLMDDLSVSVVPKERAGMATGIFTTMRVAGEAIAIAITGAIVSAFSWSSLHTRLAAPADAGALRELANRVASGDLTQLPPGLVMNHAALVGVYADAYHATLLILALVTLIGALISLSVLRHPHTAQDDADDDAMQTIKATEC
ncbi:MFS transporter [Herbaspirillum autotrophicum]|uniref:MFS transporter n=1 Tax=Herbaspirillum autotrophicum TaxID=180195 RepID=UPI0009FAB0BB|nr:MFS transporter [Herbaspirillum autotrophicum]